MEKKNQRLRVFSASAADDVAELLNVTEGEINHLVSRLPKQYVRRWRRKPDGTRRKLMVPGESLKLLQRKINDVILCRAPLLPCVYGGVRGKSVIQNAALHVGQPVVFTLDIEQCFPSIVPWMARAIFQALGFGQEAAGLLTKLTTWEGELPQGAPTSTPLANLVLMRVDWRIMALQRIHGFRYSRWVDDLTFSGNKRLLKLRKLLQRIIQDEGFRVKPGKVKTMLSQNRQTVTNLVVNTRLNLPREKRAQTKKEISAELAAGNILSAPAAGRMYWFRAVNPHAGGNLVQRASEQKS